MNTSTQVSRILAATIFAALTCSIATVSFASDSDPLQVKVKYADLNVTSTSGATTLYNRIRVAADAVCRPFHAISNADLAGLAVFNSCVRKAMSNAIKPQPAGRRNSSCIRRRSSGLWHAQLVEFLK